MKKVIAMLLAAVMVLSLAACSQPAAPAATEAATEAATTAAATQAATTAAPAATEAPAETEAVVEETPAGEKVLHLVRQQSPSNSFDFTMPLQDASNAGPGLISNELWLTLIEADKDLNPANPEIMKDWNVSDDGLTVTMTMDPDWKWSDGEPITMDDVIFTLECYCTPDSSVWPYVVAAMKYVEGYDEFYAGTADHVSGITADGDVLTIKLTAPFASFLNLMCQVAPIPKHIYGDVVLDGTNTFITNELWRTLPATSGPYMVTEQVEGNYYVLGKNPYYKGTEEYKIDKIQVTLASSPATAAQAGETDFFTSTSADDYAIMQNLSDYTFYGVPIVFFRFIAFNLFDNQGNDKGIVSKPEIRKALLQAIDWPTVIDGLFGETAALTQTGLLASDKNYAGDWYTYDPEAAKAALDAAGFDYSHTLKCYYYYSDQATIDLMDAIAFYLSQIGVQFEGVFTNNVTADVYEGQTHDLAYFGLSAYDSLSWYQMYLRENQQPMIASGPIFEEAVKELELAYTDELKAAALAKLQAMDQEYAFLNPVYTLTQQVWVKNNVKTPADCFGNGWYFSDYKFDEWDIE